MKMILRGNRIVALILMVFFSAGTILANDSSHLDPNIPVELRFTGMIKNDPLFQLNIAAGAEQDEFTISISDLYGNTLFRENTRAGHFSKNFLLNSEELGQETLRFEICSHRTKKVVVYEISSSTRQIQETAIRRVK